MHHANRDADHLNTLRQYFAQNRRIPSYQRIADLLGFASRAAAVKFMGRMEAEGFVVRTVDDDAWMPARRFFEHPLAQATVQAGQPAVAIDVCSGQVISDTSISLFSAIFCSNTAGGRLPNTECIRSQL